MSSKHRLTALGIAIVTSCSIVYADDSYTTCSINVAVSSPPIQQNERVVFNVTSERGTNRSITLKSDSEPFSFNNLICSGVAYTISATRYGSLSNALVPVVNQAIGECALKAGDVVMDEAFNSVSVVFPNDFMCN